MFYLRDGLVKNRLLYFRIMSPVVLMNGQVLSQPLSSSEASTGVYSAGGVSLLPANISLVNLKCYTFNPLYLIT